MKIFGIAGYSGMGKTTLLERLVPAIAARGLVVSLIKHSHKNIDIDRPGKDSYRLRESGCKEVLLLGNDRWALMHELRGAPEPSLDYLLDRLQHCDLVLIEGFKHGDFPKLEVWRAAPGKSTLWPEWPGILAIASDTPWADPAAPVVAPDLARLDLSDIESVATFVLSHAVTRRSMDTSGPELSEFANALIHSRHNVSPRRLVAPGPSPQQLQDILGAAAAAPDHGQLLPWRFVIVPGAARERLAEAFGLALLERDPNASAEQLDNAREKAHRAPFLMLAITRLADPASQMRTADARADGHLAENVTEVNDAERLVSLGCAIQNILLSAHAAGFGTGLTSGQAMGSPRLRALFGLGAHEQAVCCINIGTMTRHKPPPPRPDVAAFISSL